MHRTVTRALSSITLPLPTGLVTFSFPDFTDPSKPNHTTISIPSGSGWAPGAHWHESYTEHVQIKKGRAEVTIGDVTRTYGPEDGVLTFPKCTIHNFGRADGGKAPAAGGDEGDVEVEEWTDLAPSIMFSDKGSWLDHGSIFGLLDDGFKEVFFYNVMSIFQDCHSKPGLMDAIQLLTTVGYVDNYVRIVPSAAVPFAVQWGLCHGLYAFGGFLGWALGCEKWYKEYTPEQLWEVAARQGECRKLKRR